MLKYLNFILVQTFYGFNKNPKFIFKKLKPSGSNATHNKHICKEIKFNKLPN